MKKLTTLLASIGLLSTTMAVPTAPAVAQVATSVTCVAKSDYAVGRWVSTISPNDACANALYQCSIRTPTYGTCIVTGWWYNYSY